MPARSLQKSVFLVGAKRTPFGTFGGSLKNLTSQNLQLTAAKAALNQANLEPKDIDSVSIGNILHTEPASPYLARHVALKLGCDYKTPAVTVNRLAGNGFQSVIDVSNEIELGISKIGLAGAVESMSNAPYTLFGNRFGNHEFQNRKLGVDLKLVDVLWEALHDHHVDVSMGRSAENLAEKYGISREDCDNLALGSHQKWANAQKSGFFDNEIVKMPELSIDEHARPDIDLKKLEKLRTVFKKHGTVTAGNSSGVNDGAGATILADETSIVEHNLKPIARIVAYSYTGVDPNFMGIGPVDAINQVLKSAGLTKNDIGLFDINEAFAAQFLACEKLLELDAEKTNVCGGAIALGHPVSASGNRIISNLAYSLQRTGERYGVGASCIGGGQGISVLLERC